MDIAFFIWAEFASRWTGPRCAFAADAKRAVLALLLAARRQVVPVDRLIHDVWGDDAGDSTPGSLQVAVSRLRALIEPGRTRSTEPAVLVTRESGYALLAPPDAVDFERFTDLVVGADAGLSAGRGRRYGCAMRPPGSGPARRSARCSIAI